MPTYIEDEGGKIVIRVGMLEVHVNDLPGSILIKDHEYQIPTLRIHRANSQNNHPYLVLSRQNIDEPVTWGIQYFDFETGAPFHETLHLGKNSNRWHTEGGPNPISKNPEPNRV